MNAIIDKNSRIGNNVRIVGHASLSNAKTEHYSIVDGIVVTHENAEIPNGSIIGYAGFNYTKFKALRKIRICVARSNSSHRINS